MATEWWAIGLMIFSSFFSSSGTFCIKLAAPKMAFSIKKLIRNNMLIIGLFLYGLSTIFSLAAFRGGELSILYPFIALQYVWANVLSRKYLDEHIGLMKWAGIALIFVGVSLIGLGA
jgi:drug/metabolite transporter (DMT)-like permease